MTALQFNAGQVAPISMDKELVPTGWYVVYVAETEIAPTKNNTGTKLKYVLQIMDGPYKGARIYDSFNIANPNPEATRIGQGQLSALCHAVGVLNVQDSQQLHNIPYKVKIRFDQPSGGYGASNTAVSHKHISEEVDLTPQPMPEIQQAAPANQAPSNSGFNPQSAGAPPAFLSSGQSPAFPQNTGQPGANLPPQFPGTNAGFNPAQNSAPAFNPNQGAGQNFNGTPENQGGFNPNASAPTFTPVGAPSFPPTQAPAQAPAFNPNPGAAGSNGAPAWAFQK